MSEVFEFLGYFINNWKYIYSYILGYVSRYTKKNINEMDNIDIVTIMSRKFRELMLEIEEIKKKLEELKNDTK